MIETTINTKNINEADVVILGAPYEKTASSGKGTKNGPKEIIKCLDYKLEFFDRDIKKSPNAILKTAYIELKNISHLIPEKAIKRIEENYSKIITANKFPILLGGEHSVSIGALNALSKKIKPENITILQIDAHCDLRNDDGDYPSKKVSKLAHSCVMRRVSELGYKIVQVGIRTYSKEEFEYFSDLKNNITVFEWGLEKKYSIQEIINSIKTEFVYLSIDVDGFDPGNMPGTGTPVQGGIEWYFGLDLIKKIVYDKKIVGADIVEVSPIKDSVLTEYGAAQICYSIMTHQFKNKLS